MFDYSEVLIADPNTQTITITSADGSRVNAVRATVSLGVEVRALQDTAILATDRVRLKRATARAARIAIGDTVAIPDEPDYVVQDIFDQPRTDSILYELELADPDDA